MKNIPRFHALDDDIPCRQELVINEIDLIFYFKLLLYLLSVSSCMCVIGIKFAVTEILIRNTVTFKFLIRVTLFKICYKLRLSVKS